MAQNNNSQDHFITNLKVQMKQQKFNQTQNKGQNKKRIFFAYNRPKIRKLPNLLKRTNINTAFKNTIQQYTKSKTTIKLGLQHELNL
jgi:hypothetical protein